MKTAISIDKKLYDNAESFSYITGLSLNKLYSAAINEYIQNHTPDIITERLNNYYRNHESRLDDDIKAAAYRLIDEEDW
jgi:hypothetical protein